MRKAIFEYVFLIFLLVVSICDGYVDKNVKIERVTDAYGLSEGPHWDNNTQMLYFVDIYYQYIRRYDPKTGVVTSAYTDHGTVGVVVPVANTTDQFIAGVGKDVVLVKWDGKSDTSNVSVTVLCSLDCAEAPTRTNDGKVDSKGRLWIGTMGDESVINGLNGTVVTAIPNKGSLFLIKNDFKPKKKISPVSISNGLAWNSKDNTMYYIDSPTLQVAAYDYNPNNGKISNKRIVFDLSKTDFKGVPDGMTIDTDDQLWIALFGGYHVIRVDPKTGKVTRRVQFPVESVSSVAFGGPDLDVLYVTTSMYTLGPAQGNATPDAGAVFAVTGLGVHGVLANSFVMD